MNLFYRSFIFFLFPFILNAQIISQYVETAKGSNPKGIEIYNNTGATLDFSTTNLTVWLEQNGAAEALKHTISSGTLAPNEVLVIGTSGMETDVTANNPNCQFYTEGWQFNGNDNLIVKLDGNVTDTFGRALNNGTAYYASYSSVKSSNQNIERKLGIFSGDLDFFASTQTNTDNISLYYNTVVNFPSGYPDGASELTASLQGFGIPPDNIMYAGGWKTWDSTANATSTTTPSGSSTKPVYIASGSATLSTTGLSFPSIEVASGATLTIDAGKDVTISSSSNVLSYQSGNFINNGTVSMNSDATNFSSLIIEGSATGNITYNRWVNSVSNSSPSDANPGWDLVGSPVLNGTLDPTTLATSGSNYGILPFDNSSSSNGSWTNTTSDATFNTTTGIGYAMAKSNEGTVAFTGVPNTFTNTDVAITNNTSGAGTHWNLVANPFPAFLALNGDAKDNSSATSSFLWYNGVSVDVLGNTGFDEGIWYWDGTDYIAKNNSSSGSVYAVPGQAFFISAESSGNVSFRTGNVTTQASIGSGDDFIPGDDLNGNKAEIHISATQNLVGNSTEIYFNEFGSDELNEGYDTRSFPSSVNRIYSRLVENDPGVNLAIQTLSFDEMWDKTIPIGINANSGEELTIGISYRTTPADLKVYLEDTELNTLTNLVEENYVLIPQMDIQGVGRYFIHTSAETMSSEEVSTSLLNVYNEVNTNFITIEGLATQSSNTTVSLYNILGGKVLETVLDNSNNNHRIPIHSLSKGIYIIELHSASHRLTKKLLIQ